MCNLKWVYLRLKLWLRGFWIKTLYRQNHLQAMFVSMQMILIYNFRTTLACYFLAYAFG